MAGYGKFGGKPTEISCGKRKRGRNAALPDRKTENSSQPLLFPAENPKRSGKGAWHHQPGGIRHTFTGSPETAEKISAQKSGRKGGGGCMRGKKPKERNKYLIRMGDGTLVEVNREIYLEWYQSERRERYQRERDRKYGVCSIERLYEEGYFPEQSICMKDMTQEVVLRKEYWERLGNAFEKLPEQDVRLLKLLYFEEITVKKVAEILGCSRKTVENRHRKILRELLAMIDESQK